MRLQKYLAGCGIASRRNAEKMILEGRVSVNGQVIQTLGTQVDEAADIVQVDGITVHPEEEKHYLTEKGEKNERNRKRSDGKDHGTHSKRGTDESASSSQL